MNNSLNAIDKYLANYYKENILSSIKSENRRVEQVPPTGCWYQWEGGGGRERDRRVNTVKNLYTCM
jgi:hypothetical protein